MINILHLNASNFYGGPEKQIVEHLKRLDKSQYQGMVASFSENNLENEILNKAEESDLINIDIPIKGPFDPAAFKNLKAQLISRDIHLLCTHGFKSTFTGWWVSKNLPIPQIVFSRGYTAENLKVAFYEWLERRILEKTDAIISVSEGQRRKLNKYGINHSRHYVVHNAVEPADELPVNPDFKKGLLEKLDIPESAVIALAVGRLSPEKGHNVLIKAMTHIKESTKNLYLLICGDGVCQEELEKLTQNVDMAEKIKFLGFRRDMAHIYQMMDFLVLPSFTEGLPNVVLEAFAHKKPVVATRVGGVPELVTDGINGVVIPPNDMPALADGIYFLYQSDQKRNDFGKKGLITVTENFSFDFQNRKLERIYDQVLSF